MLLQLRSHLVDGGTSLGRQLRKRQDAFGDEADRRPRRADGRALSLPPTSTLLQSSPLSHPLPLLYLTHHKIMGATQPP